MASSSYSVIRTESISAPASVVYGHVACLRRWEEWSPWVDLDPAMQTTYTGPDEGVGAVYEWSGNRKAGAGSMEITTAVEDEQVVIALSFRKPFRSESTTTISLTGSGGQTQVEWVMQGQHTLMSRVMGIFMPMDKLVGPDFEKGLGRLKAVAEGAA